jgi:predicted anti-sigma-YlaC factor YlaD
MTAELTPSCLAARIWASAEIDGEATRAEREALDRHVAECTACRDWTATAGALALAVRAAEPVAAPATIAVAPADEHAMPAAARRRPRRPRSTGGIARVAAVAAVAAAGFALAGASTAPERSQPTTLHTVTVAQAAAAPCRLSLDLHGHLIVPRTCL